MFYLRTYGNHLSMVSFYMKHQRISTAVNYCKEMVHSLRFLNFLLCKLCKCCMCAMSAKNLLDAGAYLGGGALGHDPLPQESKFYFRYRTKLEKVYEQRSIFPITRFAPPPLEQFLDTPPVDTNSITSKLCKLQVL